MITIRLLGPPAIERDGVPARPPRGRKAWALLAYVLLAERPPSRKHLAELLFGDADDPLGALRWTLAELRRTLGTPTAFSGDPVPPDLGEDITVDVPTLLTEFADPALLLDAGGELLAGVQLTNCLEFEAWLLVARHRVSAAIEARLRQRAVALLTTGRPAEAIGFASRAVARNPLEENNHELLVRCLAVSGDRAAARRQIALGEDIMRRELGVVASPALREAAEVASGSAMDAPLSGRAAAVSQLEAGRAAIAAGASDAGIQCLRRAVTEAQRCRDTALQGRALLALGGALVHAVRGRDEEGSVVLHEAIQLGTQAAERSTVVSAYRELGFVEVQAGRRATGDAWLAKAQTLAEGDAELAPILGVRGMSASDHADYPAALDHLAESAERAAAAGDPRQQAFSLGLLGRSHLLRGDRSQALEALTRSLDLVREQRWMAFLPFPQTLRAEADLLAGDVEGAADELEQAWVLACQVADPCWEGLAARGLGLVHISRGHRPTASDWLATGVTRCTRVPDAYRWIHAHVLDTMIANTLAVGDGDRAAPLIATLSSVAARAEMRELVVRAHLHRYHLGDTNALASARLLAADIDNPALAHLLSQA